MKIIRILALVVVGMIWVAGCSSTVINELYRLRVLPDDYRYGDLYRLSNLKKFKDLKVECPPTPIEKPTSAKKVALYIIGDSFTEPQRVDSSDFIADHFQYAHWGTLLHLRLDTSYTNIVLLQSVERTVREHFASSISSIIPDTATFVALPPEGRFVHRLDQVFASSPTEDRLNTLLFQFDPMLKLREMKSWLNHHIFSRNDPKVTVSADGETIAYHVDTDTTLIYSSFVFTPDSEIDSLVKVIQDDETTLKKMGFDHVWLSIIPNKASVLMPEYGPYNRLIDRIYQHPGLPIPTVDVLHDFQAMQTSPYLLGDSHWSCAGQALWLAKVNRRLSEVFEQKNSPAPKSGTTL